MWVTVFIGIAISLFAFKLSRDLEERRFRTEFKRLSDGRFAALKQELSLNLENIIALKSFFDSSNFVSREEFQTFTSQMLANHPSIQALEWIPRVSYKNRDRFENTARDQGFAEFKFIQKNTAGDMVPAGSRDEYYPVYYVEPMRGNEKAFGYDLASNSTRLTTLEKSRDLGQMLATGRITLVQETEKQYGFLVFSPIYDKNSTTVDERRKNLQGFVLGVIRIGDIVKASLTSIQEGNAQVVTTVFDESAPVTERQLFTQEQNSTKIVPESLHHRYTFEVAGRTWGMLNLPTANFSNSQNSWQPFVILLGGLVLTGLLTVYLLTNQDLEKERRLLSKRVEERTADLSSANAELARGARMKDEFLASMSHELRTPLTAILGISESLAEGIYGDVNDQQSEQIAIIEESGRHLLDLINDILDLSKVEAGKLELELDRVNVSSLCEASLQFIKQMASQKEIKVSFSINSTTMSFQADERRMKQILVNLLTNAVKFTPEGNAIGLKVDEDIGHECIRFTVWDTGIGIADEDMEKLFNQFVQLDSKLSREYEGTGLGLSLASRLAELHGGGVSIESELEKGSRFTVSIPLISARDASILEDTTQILDGQSLRLNHALIVEDSPSAADQVTRYLSSLGISSVTRSTGGEGVELAREERPDLIILDIQLPDIPGWEVLKRLKSEKQTKNIPVLITSVIDERSRGLTLGAAGYLVKPITREQFEQALHKIFPDQFDLSETKALVVSPEQAETTGLSEENPLILLVEDNEKNISMFSDYLTAKNYRVSVARNGREGIERAREIKPSLILMDMQMPVMDGIEAIKRIRKWEESLVIGHSSLGKDKNNDKSEATTDATPSPMTAKRNDVPQAHNDRSTATQIPIIALTALAMKGDRERCLDAGANDYMSKPVQMKKLVEKIEKLLG